MATSDSRIIEEITSGEGITFAAAAALIPPYRRGRPVSPSTLFRWVFDGVRLPGGRRHQSDASAAPSWVSAPGPPCRPPRRSYQPREFCLKTLRIRLMSPPKS